MLLVACGSSHKTNPDAPKVTPDVAVDSLPTGMVSVHVVVNGVYQADAPIAFQLPTGEVSSTTMTDANGAASGTITAGGSVTTDIATGANPSANHALFTVFDVQPGDQLTIGTLRGNPVVGGAVGSVQVTYASSVTNAVNYRADLGCKNLTTSDSNPVTLAVTSDCLASGGTFDIIATATDGSGNLLGYAVASDLTPPGAGNTLNQTMPSWRTDLATDTITVSNAPAGT